MGINLLLLFAFVLSLAGAFGLLLEDVELVELALGEGDGGLVALADDEEVLAAGGEGVVVCLLDVDDVERGRMVLGLHDDAVAAHVVATGGHDEVARLELDMSLDGVLFQVELPGEWRHLP